jgi:hypothetical protein
MTKTEHHDFTKATSSYYSSKMTSMQYLFMKNILDKKPEYYTPDWQIQKTEQQKKKEILHH